MRKNELFTGKVAWITGASSGIGEALVYQFANGGAKVIVHQMIRPDLKG